MENEIQIMFQWFLYCMLGLTSLLSGSGILIYEFCKPLSRKINIDVVILSALAFSFGVVYTIYIAVKIEDYIVCQ